MAPFPTIDSLGFPDWKKIGWHVGKNLRDILNPPKESGPTREERRTQRLRDNLKGFVYFDDFDEVHAWDPEDIDPIQVANTPLLKRPAAEVHDQKGPSTSTLLCHDYSGQHSETQSLTFLPS